MKTNLLIAFAILALMASSSSAQDDPFGVPDTLRIGNVEASSFTSFSVPVYLFNDEPLMGLTLPLALAEDSLGISIDSISFNLDRVADCQFYNAKIDAEQSALLIGIIASMDVNEVSFESGDGILFEIHCTVGEVIEPEIDTIITTYFPPFNSLMFVGDEIMPFVPIYVPGIIRIDPTNIEDLTIQPRDYSLEIEVYPNPFNASVNLKVFLNESGKFELSIYNIIGQIVYQNYFMSSIGLNIVGPIDMRGHPSGIYFIKTNCGKYGNIAKALLLK